MGVAFLLHPASTVIPRRRRIAAVITACVVSILAGVHAPPAAASDVRNRDWSGDRPPRGWDESAYSPDNGFSPDFGDDYRGPRGEEYDPREDPHHPLKNPTKDPGEEWEGSSGAGLNQVFVGSGKADWPWGERYYDSVFAAPLVIHNKCDSPQDVGIFVYDNPYLTMPNVVTVPPGDTTVTGTVQLAPEPPGPHHSGDGWIDFGNIIIPPGMMPPPTFHQPNFEEIEGEVVVWHAWSPSTDCNAVRKTYTISGHMHFRPPPPPGGGPERLATTDLCTFYWLIGEPPAQLGDKDCTEEMRALASRFVDAILGPYVRNSPDDWAWLPSLGEIASMSIPEMLAMKAHAEAVMGVGPGAEAAAAGQPPPDAPRATNQGAIGGPSFGRSSPRDQLVTREVESSSGGGPSSSQWTFDRGGAPMDDSQGTGQSPRLLDRIQRGTDPAGQSGGGFRIAPTEDQTTTPPSQSERRVIRAPNTGQQTTRDPGAPIEGGVDGAEAIRIQRTPTGEDQP